MKFAKVLVILTAIIFIGYGILFMFSPINMLRWVAESEVTSSSAVIDIRATYGGMSLAVGFILFMLSRRSQTLGLGLASTFVLMLGMAIGRSIGILLDQDANNMMYIYLGLELSVVVISGYLIKVAYDD